MSCACCDDTGSLSKDLDGQLDCTKCGAAEERTLLEAWANSQLRNCSAWSLLWLVHQRAMAQAAEQLATG